MPEHSTKIQLANVRYLASNRLAYSKKNLYLDESSGLVFTVHKSMGSIFASENTVEFIRDVNTDTTVDCK